MRYGMLFLFLLAALTGCAHISHHDPETGLEVSYTGGAHGAVELVHATDVRSYDLAKHAMDEGMSTSLARDADGDVRFNAGYGYGGYYPGGNVGGYAPGNVGYIPGQGFMVGPSVRTLTPLATTTVVTGVPQSQVTSEAIVPCPVGHAPTTSAEQAACTAAAVLALTESRVK